MTQQLAETWSAHDGPAGRYAGDWNSENSKANRIKTMKGPAESGQICSVGRRKIAKKIAKNKRCYANTLPHAPVARSSGRKNENSKANSRNQ
jgi:hypothetical protein